MIFKKLTNPNDKADAISSLTKYLRPLLLVAVLVGVVYLIYHVGPKKIIGTLSGLSPTWVAASMIMWAMNICFATLRYRSLAAPELKFTTVLEIMLTGYLLNYVSMIQGAGIGAKVGLMKSRGIPVSNSLAGTGGELVLDLLFTGLISGIFIGYVGVTGPVLDLPPSVLWPIAIAVLFLGIAILIVYSKYSSFGSRVLQAFRATFSKKRVIINILATIGVWSTGAAGFFCMLHAAQARVPFLIALAAICVGFVVGLISLVPGGLGVRDLSWAYICTIMAGIPMPVTTTAAFSYRVTGIVFIAATLGAWTLFKELKRHKIRINRKLS